MPSGKGMVRTPRVGHDTEMDIHDTLNRVDLESTLSILFLECQAKRQPTVPCTQGSLPNKKGFGRTPSPSACETIVDVRKLNINVLTTIHPHSKVSEWFLEADIGRITYQSKPLFQHSWPRVRRMSTLQ